MQPGKALGGGLHAMPRAPIRDPRDDATGDLRNSLGSRQRSRRAVMGLLANAPRDNERVQRFRAMLAANSGIEN